VQRPHQRPIHRSKPLSSQPSSSVTVSDPGIAWAAHLCRCESPALAPHAHMSSMEEENDRDVEDEVGVDSECTLSNPS
jgi:hypothetical protein